MMSMFTPADWRDIRLVAFDVDGTLYRQRPLRLRMGRDMVLHSIAKRDLSVIGVVSAYRRRADRRSRATNDYWKLRPSATEMKTAIWPRVSGASGQ